MARQDPDQTYFQMTNPKTKEKVTVTAANALDMERNLGWKRGKRIGGPSNLDPKTSQQAMLDSIGLGKGQRALPVSTDTDD